MRERRRFFRVGYSTKAVLSQGDNLWHTDLFDLSLQGALLAHPENWPEKAKGIFFLSFKLDDSDIELTMDDLTQQQRTLS